MALPNRERLFFVKKFLGSLAVVIEQLSFEAAPERAQSLSSRPERAKGAQWRDLVLARGLARRLAHVELTLLSAAFDLVLKCGSQT